MKRTPAGPQARHRSDSPNSDDEPVSNPFPDLEIRNSPHHSAELENVRQEQPLPLDTWFYMSEVINPPAIHLGAVYKKRKEAWEKSGWARCNDFLGSGGFGKVYLGLRYDERHEKDKPFSERHLCAIKEVILKGGRQDLGAVRKGIAMEAYCLNAFAHINIVRFIVCYTVVKPDPKFYFVMEFADSKDLHYEIYQRNKLVRRYLLEPYARKLFRGIVSGVAYMHDRGVAHLDLKPANILLKYSSVGDEKVPKITDFGLAFMFKGRVLDVKYDGEEVREIHHRDEAVGTRRYCPPESLYLFYGLSHGDLIAMEKKDTPIPMSEQDERNGYVDPRSTGPRRTRIPFTWEYREQKYHAPRADVYSLGVTLFEMLAGEKPYNIIRQGDVYLKDGIEHIYKLEPKRCHSMLSDEAFAFICTMLEPATRDRATIEKVRSSAWLVGFEDASPAPGPDIPESQYLMYTSPVTSPIVAASPAGSAGVPTSPSTPRKKTTTTIHSSSPDGSS